MKTIIPKETKVCILTVTSVGIVFSEKFLEIFKKISKVVPFSFCQAWPMFPLMFETNARTSFCTWVG